MKTYTLGEIFRLGLLKNYKGEPYKDKASVSNRIARGGFKKVATPWGIGYALTEAQIKELNQSFSN